MSQETLVLVIVTVVFAVIATIYAAARPVIREYVGA